LACSGKSNALEIVVNELPVLVVDATSTEICLGELITLTADGADMFEWNNNVENGVEFAPEESATYVVLGTNSTGCSAELEITITVNPMPSFTLGDDVTVCVYNLPVVITAPAGFEEYLWTGGVQGTSFTASAAGTYSCTVTNTFGCNATESIQVIVSECLGLNAEGFSVAVYPNPFDSRITIVSDFSAGQIALYDLNGSILRRLSFVSSQTELDLSDLASGVYFIEVANGSELHRTRIVKH
jgi:hypothetical protein